MNAVTAVSGVVLFIGLASFGVFAWALRTVISLDRAVDAGDIAVLSVFVLFGLFCLGLAWLLFRTRSEEGAFVSTPKTVAPPRRVTLSHGCATAGVLLLMLSVLVPAHWYPVALLFVGLALLAVSHVLTPCEERLAKLRRARESMRQL
jgi:hypothetical protein